MKVRFTRQLYDHSPGDVIDISRRVYNQIHDYVEIAADESAEPTEKAIDAPPRDKSIKPTRSRRKARSGTGGKS